MMARSPRACVKHRHVSAHQCRAIGAQSYLQRVPREPCFDLFFAVTSTSHHAELLRTNRNLAGEIGEEWEAREGKSEPTDDLLALVKQIVPYHMGHNAETDAVDLLLEVRSICGTKLLLISV